MTDVTDSGLIYEEDDDGLRYFYMDTVEVDGIESRRFTSTDGRRYLSNIAGQMVRFKVDTDLLEFPEEDAMFVAQDLEIDLDIYIKYGDFVQKGTGVARRAYLQHNGFYDRW